MTLLQQVRATNAQHNLFSHGDTVVVGVSGGPDSLALLHCLRALRDELQIALHVAHLNHQLRGSESDADAEFVVWLAREWNLSATVEAHDVGAFAREKHLSIEEAARQARYAFLAEVAQRVGARVIAVAHHADDQAETVLMHFLRGAGMAGLRGMEYKVQVTSDKLKAKGSILQSQRDFQSPISDFQLVRPLLDVAREEIEDYCKENSLTPRFDRSNLDTTFFRNRLRQEAVPYLETLNPNLRRVLLRTAHAFADDYAYWQTQVRVAYASVAREEDEAIVFVRGTWRALHPALQRGTLRAAVRQLRSDLRNIDWRHIEDARRVALEKGTGAAATLPRGLMLVVGYDEFIVGDETRVRRGLPLPDLPLLHVERIALPVRGVVELPNSEWVVETGIASSQKETAERWTALLDLEKCSGEIFLRRRRPGDRFQPTGLRGHTKSLHEFMIDGKIPRAARDRLPLLVADERIVWVCGWRLAAGVHVTSDTRQVWQVTFKKKEKR